MATKTKEAVIEKPETMQASSGTVLYLNQKEAIAEHGKENVVKESGTGYYYNKNEPLRVSHITELRDAGVI